MGPIERAQFERIREAKQTLYNSPPPKIVPAPTMRATRRPKIVHDRNVSWAEAMRPTLRPYFYTMEAITKQVALYFQISRRELMSQRRHRPTARARQVGMYLCREFTYQSLPSIGHYYGGRDHTTVIHALRKIGDLMRDDPEIHRAVNDLRNIIKGM